MDESERREVEQFYANLSTQIRLFGVEEMGRRYVVVRLARIEVNSSLTFADLQRIFSGVVDLRSWYLAWRAEAASTEERAEGFARDGRTMSAGEAFLRASACWHWGQYLTRLRTPQKAEGREGRVRCYRRAVDLLKDLRIEPFSVAYGEYRLPGYLHLPAGIRDRPACVVMVDGADSVKEEYHFWARDFVRRGIAVLTVDGPGQGEMVGVLPMRPEAWEEPMAAVIDALAASGKVEPTRIGIWGSSMGGFLVSRAAAFEPRIRAAVSSGGFYDFRDYPYWPLSTQLNVMEDLMLESIREARRYVDERLTLAGVAQRIDCPYLVIHGARDELVTVEEAERMAGEAPKGEFVCLEDGYHTCTNYNDQIVPVMCDWMVGKLA